MKLKLSAVVKKSLLSGRYKIIGRFPLGILSERRLLKGKNGIISRMEKCRSGSIIFITRATLLFRSGVSFPAKADYKDTKCAFKRKEDTSNVYRDEKGLCEAFVDIGDLA